MHPTDPVNLTPVPPLQYSYVYHSAPYTEPEASSSRPSKATGGDEEDTEDGWVMGIDEAGRGPVLGPMVYAAAYCPLSFRPTLEGIGFDDSKALSADVRQALWDSFEQYPPLCYSSATLSPQAISANMLRRVPVNLNRQAEDATTSLIQGALDRGIRIRECYVDALGPSAQWQARLSALFPGIKFTVCPKADSIYKIVGAASIIAKVTRDRYIEHWRDPEDVVDGESGDVKAINEQEQAEGEVEVEVARGSGYPSDPRTQAYLKEHIDPVFGYKGIVRFSWATVKVLLDKQGVECRWNDDNSQPSAAGYFAADADNARPKIWRELGVTGVGEL